ncbi:MAG TPA: hypothetical protein PLI43_09445 [Albidovulum sp.]|uniref:hypothetical protein n=1 Tax=Albidovulum sp. TaxID=1872424 RepID=UPI002D15D834|nr:hypothetical protein [Albidovulum sp.]
MAGNAREALEFFLVQDVILTLGTVRGALGWLGGDDEVPQPARIEGFQRVSRQIEALEDRARQLWDDLRLSQTAGAAPRRDEDNIFRLLEGDQPAPARVVFRSRRAAG